MERALRCAGIVVLAIGILALGLAGGVLLDRYVLWEFRPPSDIPAEATDDFELMAEAWNLVHKVYVDREALQARQLAYGAVSGMVNALGDTGHSRFLDPEMVKEQDSFTQGEFEGIGAYVEMREGYVVIVAPIDGSPAQRAGLRPGDVVLKVDGQDMGGLSLDQVVGQIMGPAGTSVTLTILDPTSGDIRELTIVRANVRIQNVTWQRLPGTDVAHLRISAFSAGVTADLKEALGEINGQELRGLILDLRSNPGGLLDEAVGVTSQFLASGNVLLEQDAEGKVTPIPVEGDGLALDMPVVVLIDTGTASAAEIVSGALQDAGRATLVGQRTFGTGTVLQQFSLSDGSAILLATQQWLTPAGRVIWREGLAPDIEVALAAEANPLLPTNEADLSAEELRNSADSQVLRALEILETGAE